LAPAPADVERIAALTDPVVRNLQITQCYAELSRAFGDAVAGEANWCTFATWASKQAGQTIRKEDLSRTFERLLGQSDEAPAAADDVVAAVGDLARGPARVSEAALRALHPDDAFERASDAVARGNRKVFEEIGYEFARYLGLVQDGAVAADALAGFTDSLRPGDPPDGQGYLRQAFAAYAQALGESNPKGCSELMLFGNLAIGWHEQTRLQPEIAEALDAPFAEPVKLRRDLLKELAKTRIGLAVRVLLELLPGRATRLKQQLDALDRHVRELAREVVTDHLMTLAIPGRTLDLGRDVPGTFPERLATVANPELRALLDRVDPTPDTTRGSGTRDWARLPERIHYIADLFRVNQEDERLYEPPFTADQVAVIRSGGRPSGRL
jgi:hypothetical protein